MRCHLLVVITLCPLIEMTASSTHADEHVVSGDAGAGSIRWVYGGRRSKVTGPEAKPGIDGLWRVHIKVKNGDLVFFEDSTVVFENGRIEQGTVWDIAPFLNGTLGETRALVEADRRAYYKNPDDARITIVPPNISLKPFFLIKIKNLDADNPILFASGRISHKEVPQGSKHYMFGALVLDEDSNKGNNGNN